MGTPFADATYVMFFEGTGDNVAPRIGRVGTTGFAEGPLNLEVGTVPPYVPSLSYAAGRLTAAWTVNLGNAEYEVRLAMFGASSGP